MPLRQSCNNKALLAPNTDEINLRTEQQQQDLEKIKQFVHIRQNLEKVGHSGARRPRLEVATAAAVANEDTGGAMGIVVAVLELERRRCISGYFCKIKLIFQHIPGA